MKNVLAILAVLSLLAFAGQIAVSLDPIEGTDADMLVYDNGTANWLTWGECTEVYGLTLRTLFQARAVLESTQ